MKILISNDDGYQADGINFLKADLEVKHDVTMIAPNKERSSCGHGLTLGEPLRVKKINDNTYSCSGYPADCILVGVGNILKDDRPDLVVSGINHGANLGQDRYYSGTIAAAREASFRGVPSIAISLVSKSQKDVQHFEVAAAFVVSLIDKGIISTIPKMSILNINVPNLPADKIAGVKYTTAGIQNYSEEVIERKDGRGESYFWVGGTYQGYENIQGSDCTEVNNGFITLNLQDLSGKESSDSEKLKQLRSIINDL